MKLLFLSTEDSTFWSHRLALARALKKLGIDVVIMTRNGEHSQRLKEEGFRVIPWRISRKSLNPVRELDSFLQVLRSYRNEQPDLVHHIALKSIVYGSFAARLCRIAASVNTVTGLGPIFTRTSLFIRIVRSILLRVLRVCLRTGDVKVIFQNNADQEMFLQAGITIPEKAVVVPGFGVNTNEYAPSAEPTGEFVVILPARMLWEKGVREFVEAARELRKRDVAVRMVLVGAPDQDNSGCIPEHQLREWSESGDVEWWGHQADMPAILNRSHVVCLPSYREGLPRVLLEAAACGRAIVTTDSPGCSYVVRAGENGLLIPIKNPLALAQAIQTLMSDKVWRLQMGAMGRDRAVKEFSDETITLQTLEVYEELMKGKSQFHRGSANEKLKVLPGL